MLHPAAVPALAVSLALVLPTGLPAETPAAPGEVTVTTLEVAVPAVVDGRVAAMSAAGNVDLVATQLGLGRVVTGQVETVAFQTLGVTWDDGVDGDGLDMEVRTRVDGAWTGWQPLEVEPDPTDPDTPEGERAREGTGSLWVGEADAVQLSFAAPPVAVTGLELVLVDVPEIAAAAVGGVAQAQLGGLRVITRGEWGARSPLPDEQCGGMATATTLTSAVVHHTAGSNSYSTVAQAMAQIRGDQRYHQDGRGWCDLGYNFVVDKWGNVYEGREGSLTSARVGVHASGWNTNTVGVSMLGNYESFAPSAATQDSVARVIGARLGAYGVNPNSTFTYYNAGHVPTDKMPAGVSTQPRVIGHRQAAYTVCPGVPMQNLLPSIRAVAQVYAAEFGGARAVVTALYHDLLGRAPDPSGLVTWTGVLARGETNAQLVGRLTDSDEYLRLRITQAYRETLGREPEPGGMDHWLRSIRAGVVTVDDAQRRFLASAEFHTRSGGTDEGYVARLYTSVLGREASAGERVSGAAEIARIGRAAYTDSVWFSREAAERRAGAYYQIFLKRTWDGPGREHWGRVLLERGEGAVRTGIAGSEEYRKRALVRYPSI